MKTPQVLKRKSFLVLVCPECKSDKIDTSGDGGFGVFSSRSEVNDVLSYTDGDTLSQKVANMCSYICGTKHFHHRYSLNRPKSASLTFAWPPFSRGIVVISHFPSSVHF